MNQRDKDRVRREVQWQLAATIGDYPGLDRRRQRFYAMLRQAGAALIYIFLIGVGYANEASVKTCPFGVETTTEAGLSLDAIGVSVAKGPSDLNLKLRRIGALDDLGSDLRGRSDFEGSSLAAFEFSDWNDRSQFEQVLWHPRSGGKTEKPDLDAKFKNFRVPFPNIGDHKFRSYAGHGAYLAVGEPHFLLVLESLNGPHYDARPMGSGELVAGQLSGASAFKQHGEVDNEEHHGRAADNGSPRSEFFSEIGDPVVRRFWTVFVSVVIAGCTGLVVVLWVTR